MSKPKLLFYLKPDVLEIYSDQNQGSANFVFPKQLVSHQDIIDNKGLSDNLTGFLEPLEIEKLEVIILISKPLLYLKQFTFEQTGVDRSLVEDFLDSVPFDNLQLSTLELNNQDSLMVVAVNRVLYQLIADSAINLGAKILAVVPQIVFPEFDSPVLSPQIVTQIFADRKNLESANFLRSKVMESQTKVATAEDIEDDDQVEDGNSKNKLLIIGGIIFILIGILVLGLMTGLVKNPFAKKTIEKNSTPATSASPQASVVVTVGNNDSVLVGTTSAVLNEVSKDKLTVQITNGTGIIGQSTKAKDLISQLGYKTIDIAGTNITADNQTLLQFSSKVSQTNRQELVKALGDLFASITSQEASPAAKYDINLITGAGK